MVELSIIILSYNTSKLLRQCLESLFKTPLVFPFEVIVVDNASSDDSVAMIKKEFQKVLIIENKENVGFTKGNNIGINHAKGAYILLLNSDTVVLGNAIENLVQFMKNTKDIGVVGPRLVNPDKSIQPSCGPFPNLARTVLWLFGGERLGFGRLSPNRTQKVDWVSGACILIEKEVIEKVGLLDEKFFMYFEEIDLCFRIKKAGFSIFFYPDATIVHKSQGSSNRQFAIINIYKSVLYYYKKHMSTGAFWIVLLSLKIKALGAIAIGTLLHNTYLTQTYKKAFRVSL